MAQYRELKAYPGYRAGDDGTIWGNRRHFGNQAGEWREMRGYMDRHGYRKVNLYLDGRLVHRLVHRLVLEAFVGPCPDGMEGCHGNGVRDDNRLSNLRWDTPSGNWKDRYFHGTHQSCERNPRAKLSRQQVEHIRALYDSGRSQDAIAAAFGIAQTQVSRIVRMACWKT